MADDGGGWLWPMLLLNFRVSGGRGLCVQYRSRGLECDPWSQDRPGWKGIKRVERGSRGWEGKQEGREGVKAAWLNFVARHNLVDRFRLDHPEKEIETSLDTSPSFRARFYLDRVLEELTLILLSVPRSTM